LIPAGSGVAKRKELADRKRALLAGLLSGEPMTDGAEGEIEGEGGVATLAPPTDFDAVESDGLDFGEADVTDAPDDDDAQ
jgi:hypothetical protein